MFNFFKKRSVSIPPMVFKSDANAFEYMCKYGMHDYENDMPCIGGVIKQHGDSENYIIDLLYYFESMMIGRIIFALGINLCSGFL